ncbi:hypothetical protein [Cryobacterium cryoconiti]|uniref:hypothetical protein n=1 Tax=Cryobacterium cryoconiti TaxID=1259239 RepID=UPI00106CCBCD|nr:hypothetical protein [Cryobacterium cryoconiti]
MITRCFFTGLTIAASAALLVGCVPQSDHISALDREQASADQLPAIVYADSGSDIDASTTRLLLQQNGNKYFAARPASSEGFCMIMYASDEVWTSSCAGGLPMELAIQGHGSAQLVADSRTLATDEWVKAADNLYIGK